MSIEKKLFGKLACGKEVFEYTIRNASGAEVSFIEYGGTLTRISVPDRNGRFSDVICGYDSIEDYVKADGYQGALIGRVGNRIGKAKFTLDGKEYALYDNDGANHLHGGKEGFDKRMWGVREIDKNSAELTYTSPDGEEGYPGTLDVKVTYTFSDDNALSIRYEAQTDKRTVVNLTNHAYFNLGGYASGSVLDHILWLDADTFISTDGELIPDGEIASVEGTPFDFRVAKTLRKDFGADCDALKKAGGYDHCLNFCGGESEDIKLRGELYDEKTGRVMKVYTNQPSVQLYSGNFLGNTEHPFKGGYKQGKQNALCLETQKMPDGINHKNFTDTVLSPGEKYDYTTVYAFSVK